jgi:predicted nucleic acid-binding protein
LILVDTSVWVDHLREGDDQLAALLEKGQVLMHPFIVGEIACASLARRAATLELLQDLPMAQVAEAFEVLGYIERHRLHGKGIGYVDAHLLVATALTGDAKLWTRDKRLHAAAVELGHAHRDPDAH